MRIVNELRIDAHAKEINDRRYLELRESPIIAGGHFFATIRRAARFPALPKREAGYTYSACPH